MKKLPFSFSSSKGPESISQTRYGKYWFVTNANVPLGKLIISFQLAKAASSYANCVCVWACCIWLVRVKKAECSFDGNISVYFDKYLPQIWQQYLIKHRTLYWQAHRKGSSFIKMFWRGRAKLNEHFVRLATDLSPFLVSNQNDCARDVLTRPTPKEDLVGGRASLELQPLYYLLSALFLSLTLSPQLCSRNLYT